MLIMANFALTFSSLTRVFSYDNTLLNLSTVLACIFLVLHFGGRYHILLRHTFAGNEKFIIYLSDY